jgi:membrane protease YdiL (CAAX protease family)
MKHLLKNPYFIGYSALYIVTLLTMRLIENFPVSESIAILLILGVFFSATAYITSKSSVLLFENKPEQKREVVLLISILIYITLFLTFGGDLIKKVTPRMFLENMRASEIITISKKLLFFVLIPFIAYKYIYNFNLRDFGLIVKARDLFTLKNTVILIVMASIILLFQFFLGNGAKPIREGLITNKQLLFGLPLLFIWLIFEVGLVEEFFFRALVQSRLTEITKSEIGGIILSGLFFGLAHAPGFYLRGGGSLDNLGQHPSLFMSIGYSILILSVSGFFLSIIWSKTKNLWLVMTIHAFGDLLPNLSDFIKTWGIN